MVAMGAARMTPAAPDRSEVVRAELVEALAGLVNRVIEHGKADAQSALCHINVVRTLLAEAADMDDVLQDLNAAERVLRRYLAT
jgi:hypothetical protein